MISDKVVIKNPTGLHLRPAGLFCKTAMQYKSKITVYKKMKNEEVNANAKSVLSVLGACIKSGDEITIICEGEDEEIIVISSPLFMHAPSTLNTLLAFAFTSLFFIFLYTVILLLYCIAVLQNNPAGLR